MSKIRILAIALLLTFASTAMAQFRQDRHNVEYMFKWEAGYAPFVSNLGQPGPYGYYIEDLRHTAGLNLINGVCIKQEFFLGLGLGYDYMFRPADLAGGWHSALGFLDFDYRPFDRAWCPMGYARAGAHYMMGDTPYGNTLTPYFEIGMGVNWHYNYVLSNYERNYRSLILEVGVAYTQQTVYVPLRIGMRF